MKRFPPVKPEVKARLLEYQRVHGGWGSLHPVLANQNISDHNVVWTIEHCIKVEDHEARWLAKQLLILSKTQRLKLSHL